MKNLRLTPFKDSTTNTNSDLTDSTTAGLIEYGLRLGGIDSEYYLATRLQEMRKLFFALAEQSMEEGYSISDTVLKILDVEAEVNETKRFSKMS